jgi:hypothetical protein
MSRFLKSAKPELMSRLPIKRPNPGRKIKVRDAHCAWAMRYLSGISWSAVAEIMNLPEDRLREATRAWMHSDEGKKVVLSS